MKRQWVMWCGALAVAVGLQGVSGAQTGGGSASKTPWGDPDLQGVWTSEPELGVPFERAPDLGTRQTLTEEEFHKRQADAQKQLAADNAEFDLETAETANAGAVGSATSPPPHWLERGQPSRRTSMVIEPANGRVPAMTAEARARQQRQPRGSYGSKYDSPSDFTLYDRCITRGAPGAIFPAIYNANTSLVQSPGYVAITYEMIHETRVIPIGDQPQLPSSMRQILGDARAHWEGDTLVVVTRNFTDRTAYRGASEDLVMTERFRRDGADTLRYEVTLNDPRAWAAPWTAALNLKPQSQGMFEYACHEGNHAMRNMLSAGRAAERASGSR
jgi:hypothetical protein